MVQNSLEQTIVHFWVHLGSGKGSSGAGWTCWNFVLCWFFVCMMFYGLKIGKKKKRNKDICCMLNFGLNNMLFLVK